MNAPAAIAACLRELGNGFVLPDVQALYAPLLAAQPVDGARVQHDLRYGSDERHRLDVYAPLDAAAAPCPVLVVLHGGGFIRGDKAQKSNAGHCFARGGLLTVIPNYRLAPQGRWPSGPEDVAAALQWVRAQAASFGGDPDRIVLLGESAGAAHVAAAVLMRRFGVNRSQGLRGAVLLSGPYDARLERMAREALRIPTPDPRNDAYFGTADAQQLAAMSIVEQIDIAEPLPLLVGYAERDLPQMQVQAGALFTRLVVAHGLVPELLVVPDHNHYSQTAALNTGDTSLADPVLDFVRRVAFTEPRTT